MIATAGFRRRLPELARWGGIWLIVAIFSASWIVTANGATRGVERWDRALWLNFGSYAIWGLLAMPMVRLARWARRDGNRWLDLLGKLLLGALFAVLHSAVFVLMLSARFTPQGILEAYGVAFSHTLRFNFHFDLLTALLVMFADQSLGWYRNYREQSVRTARLVEQLAKLRLEAARLQLHPHFVFNALNSVAEMLYVDPVEAEQLVLRLSSLLRTMLDNAPDQMVPLRDEIDFARRYLEIERVRLGDQLRWHLDADSEALEVEIPSMLLQPLIDNAIVHGITRRDGGGELRLTAEVVAERLHLVLVNDTAERSASGFGEPSTGGLQATRRRLDHFYGGSLTWLRSELLPGRERFRVALSVPVRAPAEPLLQGTPDPSPEIVWTRS